MLLHLPKIFLIEFGNIHFLLLITGSSASKMNENALSLPSKQTQFCSKWLDKHDETVLFTGCSVILIFSNKSRGCNCIRFMGQSSPTDGLRNWSKRSTNTGGWVDKDHVILILKQGPIRKTKFIQ